VAAVDLGLVAGGIEREAGAVLAAPAVPSVDAKTRTAIAEFEPPPHVLDLEENLPGADETHGRFRRDRRSRARS
jgi:hypothetical protein